MSNDKEAGQAGNVAVSSYVEQADNTVVVDIRALNAGFAGVFARQVELRALIDANVAGLEGEEA